MTNLKGVLQGFDCWTVPHPGDPRAFTTAQRAENLAFVLGIKDERIAQVRAALPEIEPWLTQLLDPQVHPLAATLKLDRWWVKTGLQLALFPPVAGTLKAKLFPSRYYAVNEVVANAKWYDWPDHPLVALLDSLLRDIGLIVGEAIVLRRPDFRWTVNEDPKEKKDPCMTWGHVVVLRDAVGHWAQQAFDPLALARWSYADLHGRKKRGFNRDAVDIGGGEWRGSFVGWTAVDVINGGYTNDHYPRGHGGPPVEGRWPVETRV